MHIERRTPSTEGAYTLNGARCPGHAVIPKPAIKNIARSCALRDKVFRPNPRRLTPCLPSSARPAAASSRRRISRRRRVRSARTSVSSSRPAARGGPRSMRSRDRHFNSYRQHEPGLIGIGTVPKFSIGQRALLLRTPTGNVLWDCIPFIDAATVEIVKGSRRHCRHRDLAPALLFHDGGVEPRLRRGSHPSACRRPAMDHAAGSVGPVMGWRYACRLRPE